MSLQEKDKDRLQNQADVMTFICAICFGILMYMLQNPTMGGAGLVIIFPLIITVLAHLSLGLQALGAAIATGRFKRNLWIYAYFSIVALTVLAYADVHKAIARSVQARIEQFRYEPEFSFYQAVAAGDEAEAVRILDSGIDANHCFRHVADYQPFSPLQFATHHNLGNVVQRLIEGGADTETQCELRVGFSNPALNIAVNNGRVRLVEKLLNAGAKPNNGIEETPLGAALSHSRYLPDVHNIDAFRSRQNPSDTTSIVKLLIAHGADPDADHYGIRPIHWAAVLDNGDVLTALIGAGADVNIEDKDGETALSTAMTFGSEQIVTALLREPGLTLTGRHGFLALRIAAESGDAAMVERLLDHGLDLSQLYDETYQATIKHPYRRTIDLNDVLFDAFESGNQIYIDGLLRAGADINQADNPGALLVSRFASDATRLALVLDRGADINRSGGGGNTALHYYAMCKHCRDSIASVRNLLDAGADINAINDSGHTPLGMARWIKVRDVAAFLESRGATRKRASDE